MPVKSNKEIDRKGSTMKLKTLLATAAALLAGTGACGFMITK